MVGTCASSGVYVCIYAGASTMLQQQNSNEYDAGIEVTRPYQFLFEAFVYGEERNLGSMGPDLMSHREEYLLKAGRWSLEEFLEDKFTYENLPNWRKDAFRSERTGFLLFSSTILWVLNHFQTWMVDLSFFDVLHLHQISWLSYFLNFLICMHISFSNMWLFYYCFLSRRSGARISSFSHEDGIPILHLWAPLWSQLAGVSGSWLVRGHHHCRDGRQWAVFIGFAVYATITVSIITNIIIVTTSLYYYQFQ